MKVTVLNRQEALPVSPGLLAALTRAGEQALGLVAARGWARGEVPAEVTVLLVDDVMIAEVHGQYMGDPTPTDVISFPYGREGDILISVETAAVQRRDYGNSLEEELALYLVHGLLHLCGHDDREETDREQMEDLQFTLVKEVFGASGEGS